MGNNNYIMVSNRVSKTNQNSHSLYPLAIVGYGSVPYLHKKKSNAAYKEKEGVKSPQERTY